MQAATRGRSSPLSARAGLAALAIWQSTTPADGRSDPWALPYANPHDELRKKIRVCAMMSRREIGKPRVRANGGIHG